MPTTSPSQFTMPSRSTGFDSRRSAVPEWRCTRCNKLLGIYRDSKMHIRSNRGLEYLTGFPVTSACSCGTLNRAASAAT